MAVDYYSPGAPLTPAGIFQIFYDEALKDDRLGERDRKLLDWATKILSLPPQIVEAVSRRAVERRRADRGEKRDLCLESLYERVLFHSCSGRADKAPDSQFLRSLRRAFRITEERHGEMASRIRSAERAQDLSASLPPLELVPLSNDGDGTVIAIPGVPAPMAAPAAVVPVMAVTATAGVTSGKAPRTQRSRAPAARSSLVGDLVEAGAEPARQPGMKSGQARFPLQPGGLPVRAAHNLISLMVGMAAAAATMVFFTRTPEGRDHPPIRMAFSLACSLYWGVRKLFEGKSFVPGSEIVVSADRLCLPGFLVNRSGEIVIRRTEIEAIVIGVGKKERAQSLTIKTNGPSGKLTFWDGCIATDLREVAQALQSYMIKPATEGSQEFEVSLQTGLTILAVLVPLIVYFVFYA